MCTILYTTKQLHLQIELYTCFSLAVCIAISLGSYSCNTSVTCQRRTIQITKVLAYRTCNSVQSMLFPVQLALVSCPVVIVACLILHRPRSGLWAAVRLPPAGSLEELVECCVVFVFVCVSCVSLCVILFFF